jgi:hypothetical protein
MEKTMTQQLLKNLQEDRYKRLIIITKNLGREARNIQQTKGIVLLNLLTDWEVEDHLKFINKAF